MNDQIQIGPITINTFIGWHEEEREQPQPLVVYLEFPFNTQSAGTEDELINTIDFGLVKELKPFIETSRFKLIEAMAEAIADKCFELSQATEVKVTVQKQLPLDPHITASVIIHRTR